MRLAVSVPSNTTFSCVPSPKGFLFERPHRQRAYSLGCAIASPPRHSIDSPCASETMCWFASGTPPQTRYGPCSTTVIVRSYAGFIAQPYPPHVHS